MSYTEEALFPIQLFQWTVSPNVNSFARTLRSATDIQLRKDNEDHSKLALEIKITIIFHLSRFTHRLRKWYCTTMKRRTSTTQKARLSEECGTQILYHHRKETSQLGALTDHKWSYERRAINRHLPNRRKRLLSMVGARRRCILPSTRLIPLCATSLDSTPTVARHPSAQ